MDVYLCLCIYECIYVFIYKCAWVHVYIYMKTKTFLSYLNSMLRTRISIKHMSLHQQSFIIKREVAKVFIRKIKTKIISIYITINKWEKPCKHILNF